MNNFKSFMFKSKFRIVWLATIFVLILLGGSSLSLWVKTHLSPVIGFVVVLTVILIDTLIVIYFIRTEGSRQ